MEHRAIGFILDLDGTLYRGQDPVAGAAEFMSLLQKKGIPYLLLTNNSSRRPEDVAAHVRRVLGVEIRSDEVLTSAQGAARYVAKRKPDATVYAIGEDGLLSALRQAGLSVSEADGGRRPDYVVQGIDRDLSYAKLTQAVEYIRGGSVFVLTNPDRLLPAGRELKPGAGCIGAAIEAASETAPVVIGKPSPIIMGYALEQLGLAPDNVWVVGDNLHTDIGGGVTVGCRTSLVLTGIVTADRVRAQIAAAGVQPDLICNDLLELYRKLMAPA